jgi:diketogulonate reductase-like aldo/keto reductase
MQMLDLPGGDTISKLGLGTWYMGESASAFDREVAAVRHAIGRGIRLIDTAEMYGNGGAEKVVGAAMRGLDAALRKELFIVSKVLPSHADYEGVIRACDASLKRMGTDCIDLYLLHWCGSTPFQETLDAFVALRAAGKIRHYGVSNFDARDMTEWLGCSGGEATACNQILYNLSRRGPEWDILPLCKKHSVPVMAYSPLEQGRLKNAPALVAVAKRHGVTPLQIALAWVLARDNVIAIPKAVNHDHIDQNIAALDITLNAEDHALLDKAFPPPTGPSHLQMI